MEHLKKLMITVNTIIQRSNEMTREEAKEVLIIKAGYGDFVENIIDQIYDDHEAQLKAKDEYIAELEEVILYSTIF